MNEIINYIHENWMDVLGAMLGLLYLYLEIKENIWMWIVGTVMPMIYIFVLYKAGIYADCGMEAYYFLAGIYGFVMWRFGRTKDRQPIKISHTPRQLKNTLWVVTLALWIVIATFLEKMTDSTVPYIDGLSTAMSIVALWMLSRKLIEQWWVWFAVDAISVGLYIYKGIYGRAILYSIYTVMAIYGYYVWKKKMIKQ